MKVCINEAYSSIRPLNYSVPQGSASSANLFTAYCASIKSIIPDSITINGFADDHSIRKSFDADSQDQESQLIILMVGHSCKHSLLDGHYASEVEPRQDRVYHVWL